MDLVEKCKTKTTRRGQILRYTEVEDNMETTQMESLRQNKKVKI